MKRRESTFRNPEREVFGVVGIKGSGIELGKSSILVPQ